MYFTFQIFFQNSQRNIFQWKDFLQYICYIDKRITLQQRVYENGFFYFIDLDPNPLLKIVFTQDLHSSNTNGFLKK